MGSIRFRSEVSLAINNKILRDGLIKSKISMLIVFKLIIRFKSLVLENNFFYCLVRKKKHCKLLDN